MSDCDFAVYATCLLDDDFMDGVLCRIATVQQAVAHSPVNGRLVTGQPPRTGDRWLGQPSLVAVWGKVFVWEMYSDAQC